MSYDVSWLSYDVSWVSYDVSIVYIFRRKFEHFITLWGDITLAWWRLKLLVTSLSLQQFVPARKQKFTWLALCEGNPLVTGRCSSQRASNSESFSMTWLHYDNDSTFLHAKLWIPGGKKSIFTVVIHWWRSPLRVQEQFRNMTSQCPFAWRHRSTIVDVTMKRLSLATVAKWGIDDCF